MRYISLLTLFLMVCKAAYAVDPNTEIGEKYLEDQRQAELLKQLEKQQEKVTPAPNYSQVPAEEKCFHVNVISISGNSLLTRDEVQNVIDKYRDHCLGKAAINQMMQELTSLYIDQGYITSRVYIPPQDLASGTLKLVVIEGYVEAISINNNEPDDRQKLWWAMTPDWGKHLHLPDIEQALDQINRVPSASAQMKLWPGQEIGATHIQILNDVGDEVRGNIVVSNDGQEDTGRMQTRLGLEVDNLIGINDNLALNLITSTNTNALTFNAGFPCRFWTFMLSHSYSEYLNILPENTDLFGQSNTTTFNASYLLFRNQSVRSNLNSSLTVRRSERHILGVQLTPQKLVPARIAANVSENSDWGYYSVELGYVQGTKLFGATDDAKDSASGSPLAQFNKQDVRFNLGLPISSLLTYQMNAAGQYSDDSLYSSEQIHLGDTSSVRGSDTTFASGDRGFYVQNVLMIMGRGLGRLLESQAWLNGIGLRCFVDYGQVRTLSYQEPVGGTGAGVGVSFRMGVFDMDMSWAKLIQSRRDYAGQNIFSMSLSAQAF